MASPPIIVIVNLLLFCLTCTSLPPLWTLLFKNNKTKGLFHTSTLPSWSCPPPHLFSLLFPSLYLFLLPSCPPISACHFSLLLSTSYCTPPICCTPPLRSLAPPYQPSLLHSPLAALIVWLCVGLVLLTGLGRADNAGSWTMGRIL